MHERHARAAREVELGGETGGAEEGDQRHAVHVIADGLAVVEAEAAPALALGGLQALEHVEEGDRGGGGGLGAVGEVFEDWVVSVSRVFWWGSEKGS